MLQCVSVCFSVFQCVREIWRVSVSVSVCGSLSRSGASLVGVLVCSRDCMDVRDGSRSSDGCVVRATV